MSDLKSYTTEELRKMSLKDRLKVMQSMLEGVAQLTLNIRTGKEKQNHLMGAAKKQIARIQTLNNQETQSQAAGPLTNKA